MPTIITSSCGKTPNSLPGPNPAPGLPSYGQQGHDQHCCGEAIHALLHHDAVDGQPRVVGQEGLSCRTSTGQAGSAPLHGIGTGSVFPTVSLWTAPFPPQKYSAITHYTLWHMGMLHSQCILSLLHLFFPYYIFNQLHAARATQHPLKKAILGCFQAPPPQLLHPSW